MCFLFMMYYMTVRRPNLEKRFSISRYEYRVSFSVMSGMEMCLLSYFWRYEFVKVHDFSAKVIKVTFRISVSNTHILCLLFYPTVFQLIENLILLKVRKLYNFELHNALQFCFNDIRIQQVFVLILFAVNLSLEQILLILLFMLRETGKIQFFLLFLCEGSTSFCSKGFCYSYAMSCSLCVGRTFVWTGLIPRTSSGFLFMFSTGFT